MDGEGGMTVKVGIWLETGKVTSSEGASSLEKLMRATDGITDGRANL